MKRMIGIAMLIAPFVALFIYGVNGIGLKTMLIIYGGIFLLGIWIAIGSYLMDNG